MTAPMPLPTREHVARHKLGYGLAGRIRWLYVCGVSLVDIAAELNPRGGIDQVRKTLLRPVVASAACRRRNRIARAHDSTPPCPPPVEHTGAPVPRTHAQHAPTRVHRPR